MRSGAPKRALYEPIPLTKDYSTPKWKSDHRVVSDVQMLDRKDPPGASIREVLIPLLRYNYAPLRSISRSTGISVSHLRNIAHGNGRMSVRTLEILMKYFGMQFFKNGLLNPNDPRWRPFNPMVTSADLMTPDDFRVFLDHQREAQ